MADIDKLIDFLLRETPGHAKELQSDIGLLLSSLENTQSAIEGLMPTLEDNYSKIGEYYAMSRKIKKINEKISEIEKLFGVKNAQDQEDEDELKTIQKVNQTNYNDYKVDESISHGLFENYTHKRPVAFSLDGNKYSARDWKQILRIVCEVLNQKDSKIFDSFVRNKDMQGSTRIYFAYTDDRMNNGKRISGSNVYVETNHNANGICSIIANMWEKLLNVEDSIINDSKIGKYAKDYFTAYFSDDNKQYDLKNFTNKYWCNDNFGICYPLLKEVDITTSISKQKGYNNDYARYWTKPILTLNGKHYIICSQWFKEFREKLDKWISENPVPSSVPVIEAFKEFIPSKQKNKCIHYDYKKDLCGSLDNPLFNQPCDNALSCKYYSEKIVYITSKDKLRNKLCLCCGLQAEYEYLEIEYNQGNSLPTVIKKLQILRCNHCNKDFINVDLYKNYIKNKNPDYLDVSFREFNK